MSIYRKIYEQYYGSIPIDEYGRTYEIHHIDGNRNNNNIENLIAVSIEDHYKIHYEQGDFGACLIMSKRMNISSEERSIISKRNSEKLVYEGRHHFLGGEQSRKNCEKMMKEGTHPFLGNKNPVYRQIENGTLPLLSGKIQKETARRLLEEGNHQSQKIFVCPHCGKQGKSHSMKRWHFDNCHIIIGHKNKTNKKIKYEDIMCNVCGQIGRGGAMTRFHFENCKGKKT